MQSRDFVYWLQGYFEIAALVFVHEIDPSMGDKAQQGKLNAIHGAIPGINSPNMIARC